MKNKQNIRYDPLYRVIDENTELRKIEGNFKDFFDRLKDINSLGLIPEVIEMAKYSKYEHSLGTVHQINNFLSIVKTVPEKYHRPLKISAIFLHTGHFPYTYSTERALILACNLGNRDSINRIRRTLERKMDTLFNSMNVSEDQINKIKYHIFSFRDYRYLYKIYSAIFLKEKWPSIIDKFTPQLTNEEKIIALKNILDDSSPGFKYIDFADRVDFVQRDALYFGTARIDISPKHLYLNDYSKFPIINDEATLINVNYHYLKRVFYNDPDVIWFSRLYEKIVAAIILSQNFKLEWMNKYDDDKIKWLLCHDKDENNNSRNLPSQWIRRANALFNSTIKFSRILYLEYIQYPKEKDVVQIEYELVGRKESEKGLLNYPFETGVLISLDYLDKNDDLPYLEMQNISISIFQQNGQPDLTEVLKIIMNLSKFISLQNTKTIQEQIGDLISWNGNSRIENSKVIRALSQATLSIENRQQKKGQFIKKYVSSLASLTGFPQLWYDFNLEFWKQSIVESLEKEILKPEFEDEPVYQRIITDLFTLPIRMLQLRASTIFLDQISGELLSRIGSIQDNGERGNCFEALCLIKKISIRQGKFQFFINGLVVSGNAQIDEKEYDIIEFRLNDNSRAEIWIYACSIANDYELNNRESLSRLADEIHRKYPGLIIRTRYLIPMNRRMNNWEIKEDDAGRNYN